LESVACIEILIEKSRHIVSVEAQHSTIVGFALGPRLRKTLSPHALSEPLVTGSLKSAMLTLLKYKTSVVYADGRETDLTGQQAYAL